MDELLGNVGDGADDADEARAYEETTQEEALFDAPVRAPAGGAPLALYRRYRPDTFSSVIGQEHVTAPLQRALESNRVNHAYLFSGPRGCGKTTSARILARALNCEYGPRAEPCGRCLSCQDLATGGPGSIDVIEIDAASHGGVDDARDLRERAFFAPVASRYKIYIVDEAHMVTTAGFNALLKLVEEPPPHVKFIFATTEPDKVIGTIRSRTHHYPFRLVPPRILSDYLAKLCAAEGIAVESAVLPLVVRAGAGSVRDALSVLDQLLGGAEPDGVSYRQATALLGYTPDSLLDEFADAFAAGDSGGVFACVDKVIEVGQDPRRFGEDLLRRLRDLLVVAAVPDALTSGLVDVAPDQADRLSTQAAALGPGELTRAAEVIAAGLTEMRGTTAPRLYLELMCARVLLPGADVDQRGLHARLDRIERRLNMTGAASVEPAAHVAEPTPTPGPEPVREPVHKPTPTPAATEPAPRSAPPAPPAPSHARPELAALRDEPAEEADHAGAAGGETDDTMLGGSRTADVPAAGERLTVTDVRRLWPEVLEEVKGKRRFTWILLSQNASVAEVRDGTLLLALANQGARDSFGRGGSEDVLREALVVVLGTDYRIETMVDSGSSPAVRDRSRTPPAGWDTPADTTTSPAGQAAPGASGPAPSPQSADWAAPSEPAAPAPAPDDVDSDADLRDSDLEESSESHTELLARHLGAEIIAEDEER